MGTKLSIQVVSAVIHHQGQSLKAARFLPQDSQDEMIRLKLLQSKEDTVSLSDEAVLLVSEGEAGDESCPHCGHETQSLSRRPSFDSEIIPASYSIEDKKSQKLLPAKNELVASQEFYPQDLNVNQNTTTEIDYKKKSAIQTYETVSRYRSYSSSYSKFNGAA